MAEQDPGGVGSGAWRRFGPRAAREVQASDAAMNRAGTITACRPARALSSYEADAEIIARKAMEVAADVCVFTNDRVTVETV